MESPKIPLVKMLRVLPIVALLGLSLVIAPAAHAKSKVQTRHDASFDFSAIRTFDFWIHPSKLSEGTLAEVMRPRLENLVEELLLKKGFQRSSSDPDFHVAFEGQISDSLDLWGGYRVVVGENFVFESYVPYGGARSMSRGLLIIRMLVPGEENSFWGGGTFADFPGIVKPDEVWKKASKAAKRIMGGFPP